MDDLEIILGAKLEDTIDASLTKQIQDLKLDSVTLDAKFDSTQIKNELDAVSAQLSKVKEGFDFSTIQNKVKMDFGMPLENLKLVYDEGKKQIKGFSATVKDNERTITQSYTVTADSIKKVGDTIEKVKSQEKLAAEVAKATAKAEKEATQEKAKSTKESEIAYQSRVKAIQQYNKLLEESVGKIRKQREAEDAKKAELENLNNYYRDLEKGFEQMSQAEIRATRESIKELERKEKVSQQIAETVNKKVNPSNVFEESIGSMFQHFMSYQIIHQAINAIESGVKSAIGYLSELDAEMTKIRIITGITNEEAQKLTKTYNEMAISLSATTKEVAETGGMWLKQGYSMAEANELIQTTIKFSKLAGIENSEATKLLTSTLKGYKLEAKDSLSVLDKLILLSHNAATTSGDVAVALSRTANMARTAGVGLDQVFGMITTTLETTQKSASTIGESFKTMFSRMAAIKAEHLVDPETGEALNDVETTLDGIGIKLRNNNSEWRNSGEVIDEIGAKWKTLSSVQQSAVSSALGGTRQRENIMAFLENYDRVKELTAMSADAIGKADQKWAIEQESIAAKQEKLTAQFEKFAQSVANSDLIKHFLELANIFATVMNLGDGLIGKITLITIALVGLNMAFNNKKVIGFITSMGQSFKSLWLTIKHIPDALKSIVVAQEEVATSGAAVAATNPWMAVAMAIGLAVSAIYSWRQAQDEAEKKAIESAKKIADEYKESFAHLESNSKSLGNLKTSFEQLSKGVDDYGKNISLSADGYERYKQIVDEVTKLSPKVVDGYDAEGKMIVKKNELIERSIELIKAENKAKLEDAVSPSNLQKLYADAMNKLRDVVSEYGKKQYEVGQGISGEDKFSILKALGIDVSENENVVGKFETYFMNNINEIKSKIAQGQVILTDSQKDAVNNYIKELEVGKSKVDEASKAFQESLRNVAVASDSYEKIGDAGKAFVNKFIDGLKTTSPKAVEEWRKEVEELVKVLGSTENKDSLQKAMQELLSPDTSKTVNDYNATLSQALDTVFNNESIKNWAETHDIDLSDLKVKLSENIISDESIDVLAHNVAEKFGTGLEEHLKNDIIGNLSAEEFNLFKKAFDEGKLSADLLSGGIDSVRKALELYGIQSGTVAAQQKSLSSNLKDLKDTYSNLKTIVDDYNKTGILSSENLVKLLSLKPEYLQMLKLENGQLQLNEKALRDAAEEQLNQAKAIIYANLWLQIEKETGQELDSTTKELADKTATLGKNQETAASKVAKLTAALAAQSEFKIGENGLVEYSGTNEGVQKATQTANNLLTLAEKTQKSLSKGLGSFFDPKGTQSAAKKSEAAAKKATSGATKAAKDAMQILREELSALERPTDILDKKIRALGSVKSLDDKATEARLLGEQFNIVSRNLDKVQQMMHRNNLTAEMRNMLEDKYYDYQAKIATLQDRIKNNIKETLNLQKQTALLQAENAKKEALARFDRQHFGGQSYKEWKHDQDLKIKQMEKELKAKKEVNKVEKLQNELLKARLGLDKVLNDKTTKILRRQQDGSWQWEFSADPEKVAAAEKKYSETVEKLNEERKQSAINVEKERVSAISEERSELEYKLNNTLEKQKNAIERYFENTDELIQKGYKNLRTAHKNGIDAMIIDTQRKLNAIQQLAINEKIVSHDKSGVGFDPKYLDKILGLGTGGQISNDGIAFVHKKERVLTKTQTESFDKMISVLPKMLDSISELKDLRPSPTIELPKQEKSVNIEKVTCNFPNVTDKNEIQQAILELPRLALQVV